MGLLIAYFIGNISAKKYQNPFVCIKVIASQRWDVLLRHGVQLSKQNLMTVSCHLTLLNTSALLMSCVKTNLYASCPANSHKKTERNITTTTSRTSVLVSLCSRFVSSSCIFRLLDMTPSISSTLSASNSCVRPAVTVKASQHLPRPDTLLPCRALPSICMASWRFGRVLAAVRTSRKLLYVEPD